MTGRREVNCVQPRREQICQNKILAHGNRVRKYNTVKQQEATLQKRIYGRGNMFRRAAFIREQNILNGKTFRLIYRVSQEECARIREDVPYVKVYRNNPKHLCPKLNGYGDNGQRSLKL